MLPFAFSHIMNAKTVIESSGDCLSWLQLYETQTQRDFHNNDPWIQIATIKSSSFSNSVSLYESVRAHLCSTLTTSLTLSLKLLLDLFTLLCIVSVSLVTSLLLSFLQCLSISSFRPLSAKASFNQVLHFPHHPSYQQRVSKHLNQATFGFCQPSIWKPSLFTQAHNN